MPYLYIVAASHDWNDFHHSFRSPEALDNWIRRDFKLDDDLPSWTAEYWCEVSDAYNSNGWKSLQFLLVDLGAGTVKDMGKVPPGISATHACHEAASAAATN